MLRSSRLAEEKATNLASGTNRGRREQQPEQPTTGTTAPAGERRKSKPAA